jgi:hypothetical protein
MIPKAEGAAAGGNVRLGKIWISALCFLGTLLLLVWASVARILSPRGFAIAVLVLCVVYAFAFFFLFKSAAQMFQISEQVSDQSAILAKKMRYIRNGKIAIVILVLLLLNGLREIRNGPLVPLIIGAAINLCIIAFIVRMVTHLKKSMR